MTHEIPADRSRRGGLDVIRGAAIALVLVGHAGLGFAAPVGVTLFFVLSGYLITGILMESGMRGFYRRRIARLAPALLLVVAAVAVGALVLGDADTVVGSLAALSYGANWIAASGTSLGHMAHTWSLSVEEQFYLVWPLAFVLLWPKLGRRLVVPALGLVAAVIVLRYVGPIGPDGSEYRTHLRADALLLGCALALVGFRGSRAGVILGTLALAVLSAMTWEDSATGYTLAALASVLVVAGEHHVPGSRAIQRLGRISYGAYLWHLPLMALLGPLGIPATLVIAEASFRWFEEPLRKRLVQKDHRDVPVLPMRRASTAELAVFGGEYR